jgi:hypothetical protein
MPYRAAQLQILREQLSIQSARERLRDLMQP